LWRNILIAKPLCSGENISIGGYMKLDKKTLSMLTSLPDDSLWKIICAIASSSGFDLSNVHPKEDDLTKLRTALQSMTDSDISRATEILQSMKKQGK